MFKEGKFLFKKMNFRKILINNKTILLGKNQEQNEALVKMFKGRDVIIMHTVAPGSPFAVALEKKITAKEKRKIANYVACFSQDWRDNKKDVKVHWFTGKEVYKKKAMKIGTFGVKKTKTITAKKQDIEKCQK